MISVAFTVSSRGLHWDWVPPGPVGPNSNLAGGGGMNFAAGESGRQKKNKLRDRDVAE